MYNTKDVIALSCAVYRSKGNQYCKESFSFDEGPMKIANKHIMFYMLDPTSSYAPGVEHCICSVTDEDQELATTIIKHMNRLVFKALGDTLSDFNQRAFNIVNKETVTLNDVGVIASLPLVYFRDITGIELKKIIRETNFTHLGNESEKISLTCAIIETRYVTQINCFSHTAITQSNELVSWLNKNLSGTKGDIIAITGKVKKHKLHWLHKVPETELNYVTVK